MATKALSYLWATLTQGSNDAFVQASIATGLSGQTKTAFQIAEIDWEIVGGGVLGANYELAFTRKSFAAMPTMAEKSLIKKFSYTLSITTSGAVMVPRTNHVAYGADEGPVLVEDPFYAQLDSGSSSASNVVYVRIGYRIVTLTEVERLTLIANSLAS